MTKQQFINKRQANSEVSWNELIDAGFDAVECDCGLQGCDGWRLEKLSQVANQSIDEDTPLEAA